MAMVPVPPPEATVDPITIPEAIEAILRVTSEILRKNQTMIDYYIYPEVTPSDIDAYRPRLEVLYGRVENFRAIHISKLAHLVNDAELRIGDALLLILEQLMHSVNGFEGLFIKHYNPELEDNKPYDKIFNLLRRRQDQLTAFLKTTGDAHLPLADALTPPPSNTELTFCRAAVAFANGGDQGKLCHVMTEDLSTEQRQRLRSHGGAYLWWECPDCSFRIPYHITNSSASGIDRTDDIRSHNSIPGVEYRVSWLVKCHLFQTTGRQRRNMATVQREAERPGRESGTLRRNSENRRTGAMYRDRRSVSFFFINAPRRSVDIVTREPPRPPAQAEERDASSKYGCPFCYVMGKELTPGSTAFAHGQDLARHMASKHHSGRLPPVIMLEKFRVAIDGRMVNEERERWDFNLK